MKQEKDDDIFCKRMKELSHLALVRGRCMYSGFLNLNELNLFYNNIRDIQSTSYELWGGYEEAERRVICFHDDDSFTNVDFPISSIQISPAHIKYRDELSHRDYLGAVLNLGIDRSKIGDIVIQENKAYMFCIKDIGPFICENLTKVKHTNIKTEIAAIRELNIKPVLVPVYGTVSSIRLDAVLSAALHTSRSSITGLISGGKVFINSRINQSNSAPLNKGDVISVRGHGKFILDEILDQTRKNRYRIVIQKYI